MADGVKFRIVQEELCDYSGPTDVEIPREKALKLAKLGMCGIDWYFVDPRTVKVWDGKSWSYRTV